MPDLYDVTYTTTHVTTVEADDAAHAAEIVRASDDRAVAIVAIVKA